MHAARHGVSPPLAGTRDLRGAAGHPRHRGGGEPTHAEAVLRAGTPHGVQVRLALFHGYRRERRQGDRRLASRFPSSRCGRTSRSRSGRTAGVLVGLSRVRHRTAGRATARHPAEPLQVEAERGNAGARAQLRPPPAALAGRASDALSFGCAAGGVADSASGGTGRGGGDEKVARISYVPFSGGAFPPRDRPETAGRDGT
jgi:hypothetical protein